MSVCHYIYLSIYLCVFLYVCLSLWLFVCLSVCLSLCLSFYLSIYIPVAPVHQYTLVYRMVDSFPVQQLYILVLSQFHRPPRSRCHIHCQISPKINYNIIHKEFYLSLCLSDFKPCLSLEKLWCFFSIFWWWLRHCSASLLPMKMAIVLKILSSLLISLQIKWWWWISKNQWYLLFSSNDQCPFFMFSWLKPSLLLL